MKEYIRKKAGILLTVMSVVLGCLNADAISLWVGESYTWDFGGSVMGSTYNMNVSVNGGYLSVTGSGFYRKITPTQYFSGTATVTAEWDYTLYYGDKMKHQKVSVTIECRENPVSIHPTSVTLSPGETYQLGYRHAYDNQYVGAANAYFSGGNSSFSVSSSGLVTALKPGSGYVTVYSKVSSAANAPSCYVTVKDIEPTGASVSDVRLLADQSVDLSVNVSPSNATVKNRSWHVKEGSDVVSISGSRLTGLNPGTAKIYCLVNGSVRSNDADVVVTEPALTGTAFAPEAGSTGVSVFVNPGVTFSHEVSRGDEFGNVRLSGPNGDTEGTVEISGKSLRFLPAKHLSPLARYTLYVPRNAVKNKWGSPAKSDIAMSFTTADFEKANLKISPISGTYLTKDDIVTITAEPSDADIHYTLDNSEPSASSPVYEKPFSISSDVIVKAVAIREGYRDSDVAVAQFFKSQSEVMGYFPNDASPLFNYGPVCPHLKLSGSVEKSNNFRRITLTDGDGECVDGEALLTDYMIVFVPSEPLLNATVYTLDIPRDAVKTINGEVFAGFKWSFATPVMPVSAEMQGDASVYILDEKGSLKMRGMHYSDVTPATGGFTFDDRDALTECGSGVDDMSCGYTHSLVRKGTAVEGIGLAFCGETGTAASIATIGGVRMMKAGFQTSAIIGEDNSLWMCGRNDFYQLGDGSGTTSASFIKVAENVIDVAPGNGFTLFVNDSHEMWAVGRNHLGQLGDGTTIDRRTPVKVLDGVERVFASSCGWFGGCITTGGDLLTWGDNGSSQLGREKNRFSAVPTKVLGNVVDASFGGSHAFAVSETHELYGWGSNTHGQIGDVEAELSSPTLVSDHVSAVSAGPGSSLVLDISGEVTGWGRKFHSNFGSGSGIAKGFVVSEGNSCASLEEVVMEPWKFEAIPDSRFAFVAVPRPFAADYESVEWSSDHPEIATVDGNGVVNTLAYGEAIVTARFTDRFGNMKESASKVVCTDTPDNSDILAGVKHAIEDGSDWTARTRGCKIIIDSAVVGETFYVCNLHGIVICQDMAYSDSLTFDLAQSGVYIVRSGNKSIKVMCR